MPASRRMPHLAHNHLAQAQFFFLLPTVNVQSVNSFHLLLSKICCASTKLAQYIPACVILSCKGQMLKCLQRLGYQCHMLACAGVQGPQWAPAELSAAARQHRAADHLLHSAVASAPWPR